MWAWLQNIFNKTIAFFREIIKVAWPPAKEAIKALLIKVAIEICKSLAAGKLTNDQKREEAVKQLKAYAVSASITVGENLIRSVIEDAVAYLKAKGEIQ